MIVGCPVCQSAAAFIIEQRAPVPVLMNRLYPSADAARNAPAGRLDMRCCRDCGFAWNAAFDPALIVYDAAYENDQSHSPAFAAHIRARTEDVIAAAPSGQPLDLLEIGCGQGGFIGEVAAFAGQRMRSAEGFDPAWRGKSGEGPNGSRIHTVYFTSETAHLMRHQPNVIVSRHTIEHVPDPVAFLKAVRAALGQASRARIFIETPSITWILEHKAMQDLFYEHCSIFTPEALTYALAVSGFAPVRVDQVFGGQYLWAQAQAVESVAVEKPRGAGRGDLKGASERFVAQWREAGRSARRDGRVAVWGAGAKGVTFCGLVDPAAVLVDHVIDINPAKQGKHLAGSGIQVLSPQTASLRAPKTIFVMNPNYLEEIRQQATSVGIDAKFVAID